MKKIVAGVVLFLGVLLILGAIGSMEYSNEMSWKEYFIRVAIGFAACIGSGLYIGYLEDKEDKKN